MSARDEAIEMIRRICPPHLSADKYGDVLGEKFDAYRAEVLAERDTQFVAWLLKRSREDEHGDVIARLASKVARGAVRPNNLRTDFFQPGHSYTHRNGHDFRCVAVTTHPVTGEELAMGWHVDSWGVHSPATAGVNEWRHEYDGVEPPAENGEVTR